MTGIDIQPDGINLVQLQKTKSSFLLKKLGYLPLTPTNFAGVQGVNWDKLTATLFDWVRELGLVGAVTAVAIPAQRVRLFYLDDMANLSELAVRPHLEQTFPGLGSTLAMDYCRAPVASEQRIIVAATKKDYQDNYLSCLNDAGLCVKIMDIDSLAIQRATQCHSGALLWQQRNHFTLVWRDDKQPLHYLQWPATSGEQAIADLMQRLLQQKIAQLKFCGSTYYVDLFSHAASSSAINIDFFTPNYNCSERNLSDYLLAIGLAMREVPAW